jgi:hypothetical protein
VSDQLTDFEKRHVVQLRTFETLREIGVLFIAFAPLDVALSAKAIADTWWILLAFLVVGVLLVVYGTIGEKRLYDAE